MMRRTLQRLAAVAALALALACAAGSPPTDHFYRLRVTDSGASGQGPPSLDGRLGVGRLHADSLTGERAIVWANAESPDALQQYIYHHWLEAPPAMLREELAGFLQRRGVAAEVAAAESRAALDYRVTGRLLRFERVVGEGAPRARVELRLSVSPRAAGAAPLVSRTYREEVAAAGEGMAETVEAFGRATAAAFARFARDIEAYSKG